jgi:hypothetical protein
MFCEPGLVFVVTEGVESRFHVLHDRTHFQLYRGRRLPFSCFVLPNSFSMVPRTLGPVFLFCARGLILGSTEGVRSRFLVLSSWTCFRRCRVRRVTFLCFARLDSFSAISRATGPVFLFCAPGLFLNDIEGVDSCFHVLHARTRFRRYRGRRVPFISFVCPDSYSTVPTVSGVVFMFCAPGLVSRGTAGVGSCFHVLRFRTRFRWYRGHQVPFSCFALPDSFSAVPMASAAVFMSCVPGLVFDVAEDVCSGFPVLRARIHFRRYRGRRDPFSCFARPDSCST